MEQIMAFYRKKPVVIEAIQFLRPEKYEYSVTKVFGHNVLYNDLKDEYFMLIPTLEGTHMASEGDWIIEGVAGEHYPIKDNIFKETYELVIP
jgi:hypothetical protein